MSAWSIWSVSVLALVVAGAAPGQEKTPPRKEKPKKADPKKADVPRIIQLQDQLAVVLKERKALVKPRVQIRPWTRAPRLKVTVPNPMMTGKYKAALEAFDDVRARIYTVRDEKTATKLLDGLDRELLGVRRALWEIEKAHKEKKKRAAGISLVSPIVFTETQLRFDQQLVLIHQWTHVAGYVRVGNRLVVHNGTNPFLVGDFRKAIDGLHGSREQLQRIQDPKAARKVLDKMNRQILDVRRALWKRERAKRRVVRR